MSVSKQEFETFLLKFEDQVKRVDLLVKENQELKERIRKLETPTKQLPTFASIVANEKNSETENVLLVKVTREIKTKERKENNIILTGLPQAQINTESKAIDENKEKEVLAQIFAHLEIDLKTVKRHWRLKTKENNMNDIVNPMIVEFTDFESKNKATKNSYKLKTYKDKVYINNDLTESERSIEKKLRDERNRRNNELSIEENGLRYSEDEKGKFHYGIRNGIVKKIYHK